MKKKVVLKTPKKTEVTVPKPIKRIIRIAEVISVGDLAKRMGVKGGELIKKLMETGVLVNINQTIDADVASLVASEFGYEVEKLSLEHQDLLERKEDLPEQLKPRPPVVTIMGHGSRKDDTLGCDTENQSPGSGGAGSPSTSGLMMFNWRTARWSLLILPVMKPLRR
jgi:translation initiation factor IF-2